MMIQTRNFLFAGLVSVAALVAPSAVAQQGVMETCQTREACDAASDRLVETSDRILGQGSHREAAQLVYPAVLSRKTSPLVKARAANQLGDILVAAGLFEYAASQRGNANALTRAPASRNLLDYARLVARGDDEDAIINAYGKAELLARSAANVETFDAIIGDYRAIGQPRAAALLEAERPDIIARAEAACEEVDCTSRRVVDARTQKPGPVRYPSEARRGVSGDCRVTLNITEDGRPVDLMPDCTDPVFIEAAMIAVQESEFSVRYENGMPRPRYNIVIPFTFQPG